MKAPVIRDMVNLQSIDYVSVGQSRKKIKAVWLVTSNELNHTNTVYRLYMTLDSIYHNIGPDEMCRTSAVSWAP